MANYLYQLYVRRGPTPGEMFVLSDPKVVIGRDPTANLLIRDPEVSRNHVQLLLVSEEAGYQIQDLGSTNGTFINGTPLRSEPHLLQMGDVVALGSNVVLEYQVVGVAADDPWATVVANTAVVNDDFDRTIAPPSPSADLPQTGRLAPPAPDNFAWADDPPASVPAPAFAPATSSYANEQASTSPIPENPPKNKRSTLMIAGFIALFLFLLLCCFCSIFVLVVAQDMGLL
jgi:pSer/pThr/pTyr-binding forkhead associated (FHA) protein